MLVRPSTPTPERVVNPPTVGSDVALLEPSPPAPAPSHGSKLAYLYLLRVPILAALLFIAFPILAITTSLRSFAVGIFDIDGREMWAVSTIAFMVSLAIMTTTWIVVAYADDRCGVWSIKINEQMSWVWKIASSALAAPAIAVTYIVGDGDYWARTVWTAAGLLTAVMIYESFRLVIRALNPYMQAAGRWLAQFPNMTVGYVDQKGEFLPGHRFAIALCLSSFVVYELIGWGEGQVFGFPVPTLVYVLLIILIGCWAFSGFAFLFDRYRVPIILPVALWVSFTGFGYPRTTDHYFHLQPIQFEPPTAAQAFRARPADAPLHSAVVIAANGGGIQAAAWTAQTVTGIEQLCRQRPGCRFAPAIRLISSVSGGTVGSMYVAAAFSNGGLPPDTAKLGAITTSVEASSLESAGWGALYPDLGRLLWPHFSYADRGSALEQSWLKHFYGAPDYLEQPLSAWNNDVREGRRPAVIFNATIADSGERLLMSTAPPTPMKGLILPGRETLGRSLYKDQDVSIVTAARLSSTFPWVTPAARPDTNSERELHFVDGGYYDTYGVTSMLDWLGEALNDNQKRPQPERVDRVLVIQLRGGPPDQETKGKRRGWFYQTYAPLSTLLNVRDTGQLARNDEDLALFTRVWDGRVTVSTATLQFCTVGDVTWRNAPPLSWHMTKDQKAAITSQWEQEKGSPNVRRIDRKSVV